MFVRSCTGINHKIISFKNLFLHSKLRAPQKEKNPGALGTCPVCPLVKTALWNSTGMGTGMLTGILTGMSVMRMGLAFSQRRSHFHRFILSIYPLDATLAVASENVVCKGVSDWTRLDPTVPVSVSARVCHKSVFYRNGWINRAGFWHTMRYDTRCYFDVSSKADMGQLNLTHGTNN